MIGGGGRVRRVHAAGLEDGAVRIDGAAEKWSTAVDIARRAEELGYDSIWVYDHFHNVPRPAHEAVFECFWTTVTAISQLTTRIRLGQMVGCNSYRNPTLPAKITSTVDVVSGGRLELGIGAGWYNEYHTYGYEFPKPKDRIGMLRECVEIVRSMWTKPGATYKGTYYETVRTNCDPKPLQSPHPPI